MFLISELGLAGTGLATTAMLVIIVASILNFIWLVIYRLYFSPLAKFPGPRLVAATSWVEFYHNYWRRGQYIYEVEKMHDKYGPIVRASPTLLSIRDRDFYSEVYVIGNKRKTNRDNTFEGLDFDGSHILTIDHDLHRLRRKPMEPFFSRLGVTRLQSAIAAAALQLESRLRELKGTNTVLSLELAFSAFSSDVIRKICLGSSAQPGEGFLDAPDWGVDWYNTVVTLSLSIPLLTAFPWIVKSLTYVPDGILQRCFPDGTMLKSFKAKTREQIRKALNGVQEKDDKEISLFHRLDLDATSESERSEDRLAKEAQTLLAGGTISVAHTIAFAAYYVLSRPAIHQKLTDELRDPMSEWPEKVPTWADLEKLPYLQAVIKEALRLSYGVMRPLPRVSPDEPIQYKDWTIPAGVSVGIAPYFLHNDPEIYPNPKKFLPERWLGDVNPEMHKSLVSFARGSRNCLGINLAYAEISLLLAAIFRPNAPKLELFETDDSDVVRIHDYQIPFPRLESHGVRVMVS